MYQEREDIFYYLTLENENYAHAADAGGRRGGHPQGAVPASRRRDCRRERPQVQLFGSGPILREALRAQQICSRSGTASRPTSGA